MTTPDAPLGEQDLDLHHDREAAARRQRELWELEERELAGGAPRRGFGYYLLVALLALAIVGISVASAVFVASRAEKVYGARVDILYAASDDTSDDSRERILATQQELIRSRVVLIDVSKDVGMSLDDLRSALDVEVGRDDLLRVTVGDPDPRRAREVAQAVASRYFDLANELSPEVNRGRRLIQREIKQLRSGPKPLPFEVNDRIGRLQDRLLEMEVERTSRPKAESLSPAYELSKPLSPDLVRAGALGLLIGLLLASVVTAVMLRLGATRRR